MSEAPLSANWVGVCRLVFVGVEFCPVFDCQVCGLDQLFQSALGGQELDGVIGEIEAGGAFRKGGAFRAVDQDDGVWTAQVADLCEGIIRVE